MMEQPILPRIDSFRHVRFLRRVAVCRWKLILLIFVGGAVPLVVWALVLAPKTFEARATIFIENKKPDDPTSPQGLMPHTDASLQMAVLRSRSLAEEVVDTLPREAIDELLGRVMQRDYFLEAQNWVRQLLGKDLVVHSPKQRAIAELQRARVSFRERSVDSPAGEVEIRAIAYQPRVAMALANGFVEALQNRSRSYVRDEARAAREFIENYLNQTKVSLQESERDLSEFQRRTGVVGLRERPGAELTKIAQLENALAEIQASKEIAKVRLTFLRGGKDVGSAPLRPSGGRLQQLVDRLGELENQLAAYQEKYTDQHPLVVATQSEIRDIQTRLAAGLQSFQDPRPASAVRLAPAERAMLAKQMAEHEVEISSLSAREEVLRQRIAALSRNLPSISAAEMQGAQLLRRAESQRSLYNLLLEKLATARMQEQGEGRGLRVIDLATLPMTPNTPWVAKTMLMGVLLTLGLGVGLGILMEYFKQPIETEAQITELTGLPVLGWLPTLEGRRADGLKRAPLSFVDTVSPRSLPVEGCRAIRMALESLESTQRVRTIMLASAGPREGKSTVLVNLGWVFWEVGRRVLLVDSDFRRPALHRTLQRPCLSGLQEFLTANSSWDKVLHLVREGFILMPAGNTKDTNAAAALSRNNIAKLLESLNDRADLILFDSAPLLAVSDNLSLASQVDGVILVVRAGYTQQEDLLRALEQLQKVDARLLGIVINQVSPNDTRRYYARYGEYYGPDNGLRPSNHSWRLWARRGRASKLAAKRDTT